MTAFVKQVRDHIFGAVPGHRRFFGPQYVPIDRKWYIECSEVRVAELSLRAGVTPAMR